MKFGDNLKKLRKQQKISQEELGERVGVSRQSVSKWETGEAYPEMNNILELCKIFHCHINELIHEDMADIDNLDEDIKKEVVKFKEKAQTKMKLISKTIWLISTISKHILSVLSVMMIIVIIAIPFVANKINIAGSNLMLGDTKIGALQNALEVEQTTNFINNHSNLEIIMSVEMIAVCLLINMILSIIIFKNLEKLFKNIHDEKTPFTLDNVRYVKKISNYLIVLILFPMVTGFIFELITNINLSIEFKFMDALFVLAIYSISYIFEYGYEIQLDSKGVMYGKEE